MNKTKKLTQGAMMLAITGALILIDRMIAYMFTELVVLIAPVVIIIYGTIHSLKDAAILSVGMLIISFLLGNFQLIYLIYIPVGIITALIYIYGIRKNRDKRTLMLSAICTYIIGEIVASFLVYPLLGFPIATMISEYKIAMNEVSVLGMDYSSIFSSIGLDFDNIIVILYVISTILIGAMEGVLIHLLSVFLLKRFKIKDLGTTSLWDLKPNPVIAYISFLCLFLIFISRYINNETFYYISIVLAIFSAMILFYYGYLFVLLYGVIVLKRNVGPFYILLCLLFQPLLLAMLILGFLYATGPLRRYLESKMDNRQ